MVTTFLEWLVQRDVMPRREAEALHDRVVKATINQVHVEVTAEVAKGERDLALNVVELRGALDRELMHRFPDDYTAWRAYRRMSR